MDVCKVRKVLFYDYKMHKFIVYRFEFSDRSSWFFCYVYSQSSFPSSIWSNSTMVVSLFGGNKLEMNKAIGIWGASAPAGGTAGVFLGGIITAWVDWSWVFLINVPIGIVVLALA